MIHKIKYNRLGQTAIEYMLLLAVVVAIILLSFPAFFPRLENGTDIFYNRVAVGIMGETPP